MPRVMSSSTKRPRISVDVEPSTRKRLRMAAAKRDVTVSRYVLAAIETSLRKDIGEDLDEQVGLTSTTDPVLGELWDNRKDAAYDRL